MTQFAFKRTGDADYPRYLKVLLQGPPKSGKTTFITTAPNVVIASCEAGLMSIAHLDVPYVDIDGTDRLQSLELILRDDALRAQAAKSLGMDKIETVAVDTLDAWQEMLKREIMAENRRTSMQRDDWGTLKERMATIMKRFCTLPVNVIFTVHTSTTQDEDSRLIYTPKLEGSIKDDVAGFVDFSLLAFRQRETGADGVAVTNYYLKNEGDLKNPHLGNRAAGRVPEICAPDFGTLHDAVFNAMVPVRRPHTIKEEPDSELVAQTVSQRPPVPPVEVSVPAPKVSGVPADDPTGPINSAGISMLTKEYMAQGLVVPEDLKSWQLDKARKIGRWFMAWKADSASGVDVTRDDLVQVLKDLDGFSGELEGVQTGVKNLKTSKSIENPPADKSVESKPDDVESVNEESAIALVQEQLGGVVIGHEVNSDALCDECGQPVDDKDIANLGLRRYKKSLCVKDYKAAVAASRA